MIIRALSIIAIASVLLTIIIGSYVQSTLAVLIACLQSVVCDGTMGNIFNRVTNKGDILEDDDGINALTDADGSYILLGDKENRDLHGKSGVNIIDRDLGPEGLLRVGDMGISSQIHTSTAGTTVEKEQSRKLLTNGNIRGDAITRPNSNVKVTVTFDAIYIHNDHDHSNLGGIINRGTGEWDLVAYVQGKMIDLAAASGNCVRSGDDIWPCGIGQADGGHGYLFKSIYPNIVNNGPNSITIDLTKSSTLSIFTVGHELDECDYPINFPNNVDLKAIFQKPQSEWRQSIDDLQDNLNNAPDCSSVFGDDQILGKINDLYDFPDYGSGHHEVLSSSGDFTLLYTISIAQQPSPPANQLPQGEENRNGKIEPEGGVLDVNNIVCSKIPPPSNVSVSQMCKGTNKVDDIQGTSTGDYIYAYNGDDSIEGKGGPDFISGGDGNDLIDGGDGNDVIHGDDGKDNIKGGDGNDIIYQRANYHRGDTNPDGYSDTIDCGPGMDQVWINAQSDGDTAINCETVHLE